MTALSCWLYILQLQGWQFASLCSVHTAGYIVLVHKWWVVGWVGSFICSFNTAVAFFVGPLKGYREEPECSGGLSNADLLEQCCRVLVLFSLLSSSKWEPKPDNAFFLGGTLYLSFSAGKNSYPVLREKPRTYH